MGNTRRMFHAALLVVLAACLATALPGTAFAAADTGQDQLESSTAWTNAYTTYGSPDTSYLGTTSDGRLERVEWDESNHRLVVEHYGSDYRFQGSQAISSSLVAPTGATASSTIWGGFFSGRDWNFVVTGQANRAESNSVVVVRVTRFTKGWDYSANVEMSGVSIQIPFEAGSCRMAEDDGNLWIHTCRTMYASTDGLNHQSNYTFKIRESDMGVLSKAATVYTSHSFDQRIRISNGNVYTVDLGDAYPRAVRLAEFGASGSSTIKFNTLIEMQGETGDNYTGVSVGGFETGNNGSSLLVAGTIVDQDREFASGSKRGGCSNVWVKTVIGGVDATANTTMLTSYAFDGATSATTPLLVKVNENRFLVLWGAVSSDNWMQKGQTVYYAFLDANGNQVGSTRTMTGTLSDCQPVVIDGQVCWYATGTQSSWGLYENSGPIFYTIDAQTGAAASHDASKSGSTVAMRRLYNQWSGEHLFTTDEGEVGSLVPLGWTDEGVAWQAPKASQTPVYRLYNPYSGDHHYTADKAEYDQLGSIGWNQEGIGFYSAGSDGKPIYRLFNRWLTQGTHLYTTDRSEYGRLGAIGWSQEGTAFYGI